MQKAKKPAIPLVSNSMFSPVSPWEKGYDIDQRIAEVRMFCESQILPAVHDALWLYRSKPEASVPDWLVKECMLILQKVMQSDPPNRAIFDRKDYKSVIAAFYRWRAVQRSKAKGASWSKAYADAEAELADTQFRGGVDTMKKAYQRVQKDLQRPERAVQYYTAMPDTRPFAGTSLSAKRKD